MEKIENYVCENCGGVIKYSIKTREFKCVSCGTVVKLKPESKEIKKYVLDTCECIDDFEQFKEEITICVNCGAKIKFERFQTSLICNMCGLPQVNPMKQQVGVRVEGLVPFKVDKFEASEKFKKWVSSRWFAPNRLKKAYQEGILKAKYLPFWEYDADTIAFYRGEGGITTTYEDEEGKTHVTTRWKPVSGEISSYFENIQICSSREVDSKYLKNILPFDTSVDISNYSAQYLSGVSSEHYSVRVGEGFKDAQEIMKTKLKSLSHEDILRKGYDKASVTHIDVDYYDVKYRNLLLPVWCASFYFNSKSYNYFVNGETGKVSGTRPYSVIKIIIATILAIIVIGIIIWYLNQ